MVAGGATAAVVDVMKVVGGRGGAITMAGGDNAVVLSLTPDSVLL